MINIRGDRLDVTTLQILDYEERRTKCRQIANIIINNYSYGQIDIDDLAEECGLSDITDEEIKYIEKIINRR